MLALDSVQIFSNTEVHAEGAPALVAGHLPHNLAVDLVLQDFVLGGWAKDLVSQFHRTASVFDGVVAHVLQDRWQPRLRTHTDDDKLDSHLFHTQSL